MNASQVAVMSDAPTEDRLYCATVVPSRQYTQAVQGMSTRTPKYYKMRTDADGLAKGVDEERARVIHGGLEFGPHAS